MLTEPIDRSQWSGETLMYVADEAYARKYGLPADERRTPRVRTSAIDYDMGAYRITGTYVAPGDFADRYPRFSSLY
ncbi:hypothetical protein [Hymenobacter koreensis]|uniref:hypothetical protein n=1 Tax=Hymenobacter koreensis TaxID=1084523 RepID=UPI0031F0B1AF